MGISILTMVGVIYGYISSCKRAEWSAYSLAAQSLAIQRIEQARACRWDTEAYPVIDELVASNFPPVKSVLDVPSSGTNLTYATVTTTITQIGNMPSLRMIKVDCEWTFFQGKKFTNTLVTYRGPDS